ncbi:caspase family protein [Roseomonas sp. HJA6]|uniref:Caspase family protein n=1 Tax=Roseomonas alba TaxID=2846776 RepID=A0ABS7A6V5_9PROT|nr:caspase family protein [Neoroseomonas alba]MBW6398034.1 caspase family protein [Neoroseomonas alba]
MAHFQRRHRLTITSMDRGGPDFHTASVEEEDGGMRRRIMLLATTLIATAPAVPALPQAARRIALVIGNGAYQGGAPALANPPRDAQAMAQTLERLGFRVELLVDADGGGMAAAVRRLADAAPGAEAALLFFAGHAAEIGGHNLIFPVDLSRVRDASSLAAAGLRYDDIAAALQGRAATTLIFLDACRDNPFGPAVSGTATRHGLARVASAEGTLIAFATAPGEVAMDGDGTNSPFTTALLRYMETPDIEIRDMLTRVRRSVRQATGGRQVPWDNSSLLGPFFLRVAAGATASAGPTRRIVEDAAAHGVPLPRNLTELRFSRPASSGPNARLVGSWSSGSRLWGGRSGRHIVYIVLSVNEAQRTAEVIIARSAFIGPPDDARNFASASAPAGNWRRMMTVTAPGILEWTSPEGMTTRLTLTAPDVMDARLMAASGDGRRRPSVTTFLRRID